MVQQVAPGHLTCVCVSDCLWVTVEFKTLIGGSCVSRWSPGRRVWFWLSAPLLLPADVLQWPLWTQGALVHSVIGKMWLSLNTAFPMVLFFQPLCLSFSPVWLHTKVWGGWMLTRQCAEIGKLRCLSTDIVMCCWCLWRSKEQAETHCLTELMAVFAAALTAMPVLIL